jgi:hypothetical protein
MTNLPAFEGKPFIEYSKLPLIDFLRNDDFGKAVYWEIQRRYEKFQIINKTAPYCDGFVKNTTPFFSVAVGEVLRPEGLRLATLEDLKEAKRLHESNNKLGLDLKDVSVDFALHLGGTDYNEYFAKKLLEQLKPEQRTNLPISIPLADLELKEGYNCGRCLSFKIREDADGRSIKKSSFGGGRGLERVYLGRFDALYVHGDLSLPNSHGRVVVVKDSI